MRSLSIPPYRQNSPEQLKSVAAEISSNLKLAGIEYFFERLGDGCYPEVSDLECVWYISQKQRWDELNPDKAEITALSMWQAVRENFKLRKYMLRSLLRDYFEEIKIADSLVFLFQDCGFSFNSDDKIVLQCVRALIKGQNSPEGIAHFALTQKYTGQQIIDLVYKATGWQFSDIKTLLYDLTARVCDTFIQNPSDSEQLIYHFQHESNFEVLVASLDNLLINCPDNFSEHSKELLSRWLRDHVYLSQEIKQRLSSNAFRKLKNWIGLSNFTDFKILIDLVRDGLIRNEVASKSLDRQLNQLAMRSTFWQNYSQRFEQIRVLVPESSYDFLNDSLKRYAEKLTKDNKWEPTEICIFDFGEKIIVEFFRGKHSEIRLFESNYRDRLFHASLSCDQFRKLNSQIHDHVILWQGACERWLAQNGIYPNDELQRFRVSKYKIFEYTRERGMVSSPSYDLEEKKQQRQEQLKGFRAYWNSSNQFNSIPQA